ncbi:Small nuclear ribonucleoprotein G [Hyphodiscus hymeniophilus]|uniref:Small nuclear ribonucleoprotein G n=1 Tax=Hyphodiscus hymeniophilus TaxID=353542 RepID=A0A9P6VNQ1_9HELO|nr:Small nuclear ribonucleoprotein G [Hyphodiscus hymeniophilus]
MPQAQPELKKVRYTLYTISARFTNGKSRRTRLHEKACHGKGKKEKWTDPRLQYLDKRLFVQLNGSRKVIGVLRGYDVFLNIVLDDAVEEKDGGEKVRLGMVVIRGNSVVMLEALERIGGGREDRG